MDVIDLCDSSQSQNSPSPQQRERTPLPARPDPEVYNLRDDDDVRTREQQVPESQCSASDDSSDDDRHLVARLSRPTTNSKSPVFSPPSDSDDLLAQPSYLSHFKAPSSTATPLTKKEVKALLKQREKDRKATKTQQVKKRKADLKQLEKDEKDQLKLQQQQDAGKFKVKEICCLVAEELAASLSGIALKRMLEEKEYMFHKKQYPEEYSSSHAGLVRWLRREYMLGGASAVACAGNEELGLAALVIWKCEEFIYKLRKDNLAEDDHPYLRKWLDGLRSKLMPNQRIVLVLVNIEAALAKQYAPGDRRASWQPTTVEHVHEALGWMLIQEQVEYTLCKNAEQVAEHLTDMTSALCGGPYDEEITELDCFKKFKNSTDAVTELEQAQAAWLRMLQQMPGLSEAKACAIVKHYPTMSSVWNAYKACKKKEDKALLLMNCFGTKNAQAQLSHNIYLMLCCTDPKALV